MWEREGYCDEMGRGRQQEGRRKVDESRKEEDENGLVV